MLVFSYGEVGYEGSNETTITKFTCHTSRKKYYYGVWTGFVSYDVTEDSGFLNNQVICFHYFIFSFSKNQNK